MVVDPRTCYWSNADGDILEWSRENGIRIYLKGARGGLCRDYFGQYSSADPGHMAYHWRSVQWVGEDTSRVHGNSGYLFRLRSLRIEHPRELSCLTVSARPHRSVWGIDFFSYGYLGLLVAGTERLVARWCTI